MRESVQFHDIKPVQFPSTHQSVVHRAVEGDESARRALAEVYYEPLRFAFYALGVPAERATEATHAVMERILEPGFWTARKTRFAGLKLRGYLMGVVKNVDRELLRKERRLQYVPDEVFAVVPGPADDVDVMLDAAWGTGVFQQILRNLESEHPLRYRVFLMINVRNLSYAQIQEELAFDPHKIDNENRAAKRYVRDQALVAVAGSCEPGELAQEFGYFISVLPDWVGQVMAGR